MADQHHNNGPARRTMPRPGCREAPEFKQDDPSNLIRFLEFTEDLFEDCSITDDAIKKKWAGRYADTQSETEWKALPQYDGGSWDAFKRELLSNYPEALEAAEGSVSKLEKVCKRNAGVGIRDLHDLRKLKREFMAIANKLKVIDPPVVSNRELVRMFMGSLDENFAGQVYNRLSITEIPQAAAAAPINNAPDALATAVAASRRREDMYTIDQVVKAALEIGEGASTMFATNYGSMPTSSRTVKIEPQTKQELDEVRGQVAEIKDRINLNEKTNRDGFATIAKALQLTTQQTTKAINNLTVNHQHGLTGSLPGMQQAGPTQTENKSGKGGTPPGACHYCHVLGHYIPDCEVKKRHEREGKIRITNGRAFMVDGTGIPYHPPDKSMEAKVEDYYANRVEQFYFGQIDTLEGALDSEPTARTMSIYTNNLVDARDDRIHRLQEELKGVKTSQGSTAAAQVARTGLLGFDPDLLTTQLGALLSHISDGSQQSQFANTRSGKATDKQSGF
jgi:hypothetical protein